MYNVLFDIMFMDTIWIDIMFIDTIWIDIMFMDPIPYCRDTDTKVMVSVDNIWNNDIRSQKDRYLVQPTQSISFEGNQIPYN